MGLDLDRILEIALQMHRAIAEFSSENLPLNLREFPRGACGDASMLLGAYLSEQGFTDFEYVSGHRGSIVDGTWTSHAWLEAGGVVVDITAGQFEDAPERVIVAFTSPWHLRFEVDQRERRDFSDLGESPDLIDLYSRLKKLIRE